MAGSEYQVELVWRDGREEVVRVPAEETVLDATEDANVGLPFGCRTGACATCTGRLLSGKVEHRRPPRALKRRHLDDGYVLLCIATPLADSRVEVGAAVADDLVSNPWK
jgi:ferredoxin